MRSCWRCLHQCVNTEPIFEQELGQTSPFSIFHSPPVATTNCNKRYKIKARLLLVGTGYFQRQAIITLYVGWPHPVHANPPICAYIIHYRNFLAYWRDARKSCMFYRFGTPNCTNIYSLSKINVTMLTIYQLASRFTNRCPTIARSYIVSTSFMKTTLC